MMQDCPWPKTDACCLEAHHPIILSADVLLKWRKKAIYIPVIGINKKDIDWSYSVLVWAKRWYLNDISRQRKIIFYKWALQVSKILFLMGEIKICVFNRPTWLGFLYLLNTNWLFAQAFIKNIHRNFISGVFSCFKNTCVKKKIQINCSYE